MIVANKRISTVIDKIECDILFIGNLTTSQPKINDALFQTFIKMHDEKGRIEKLKDELKISGNVPIVLLEIFNLTHIIEHSTLRHSIVHHIEVLDEELNIRVTLLNISSNTQILKADPPSFSFYAIEDNMMCNFRCTGPEYVLYNSTADCIRPLLSEEIVDDIIIDEGCRQHRHPNNIKYYEPFECKQLNTSYTFAPKVQIKHNGQHVQINCYGHFIKINGTKLSCPNYVFGIEENTEFSINGFTYRSEHISMTRNRMKIDIGDKVNLHLGLSKIEFHTLTTEELQQLNDAAKETKNKQFTNSIIQHDDDKGFLSEIGDQINNVIDIIGEYLSIVIAIFLLVLYLRARIATSSRQHRAQVASVGIIALLPGLAFGFTNPPNLTLQYSAEEATNDIKDIQSMMIKERCNSWSFNENWSDWADNKGYYPVTLSCMLAHIDIKCPCATELEVIPILNHEELASLPSFGIDRCDTADGSHKYEYQLAIFDKISHYLCTRAG